MNAKVFNRPFSLGQRVEFSREMHAHPVLPKIKTWLEDNILANDGTVTQEEFESVAVHVLENLFKKCSSETINALYSFDSSVSWLGRNPHLEQRGIVGMFFSCIASPDPMARFSLKILVDRGLSPCDCVLESNNSLRSLFWNPWDVHSDFPLEDPESYDEAAWQSTLDQFKMVSLTAANFAVRCQNWGVLPLLKQWGMNLDAPDPRTGMTPFQAAFMADRLDIAMELRSMDVQTPRSRSADFSVDSLEVSG